MHMDLSKVKMVVTDMDGTLLNSAHQVSDRFYELFKQLKERNIIFVAASGRQYNSIVDKLKPIKDDILVVAENGGFVMQQETELLSTPLPKAIRNQALEIVSRIDDAHAVLCGKKNAYITGDSHEFGEMLRQYYSTFDIVDSLYEVDTDILKIAVYHAESSEAYIYPGVKHLEHALKVKVSGPNWVDLSDLQAHKGHAIAQLQEKFGIDRSETMVFGDYNNDLEMLGLADYSFAMANAHENVLKAANYTTLSNDDNGVEHILEQLIAAK